LALESFVSFLTFGCNPNIFIRTNDPLCSNYNGYKLGKSSKIIVDIEVLRFLLFLFLFLFLLSFRLFAVFALIILDFVIFGLPHGFEVIFKGISDESWSFVGAI
jgi:hypothetical protein